jgi:hypothetical protein
MSEANGWLRQHDWKQVWPIRILGSGVPLSFAGPPSQRYLRLHAESSYYIWGRELDLDPHELPVLSITWGIDRFPDGASMEVYKRHDRPIVIMVAFGPEVPSGNLLPDVPRSLAFFWGEKANVGKNYTCTTPRQGPEDAHILCNYPHVKYIALRAGDVESIHTDQVNLVEAFQQQFPDYWQQHQRVPPIVGVSFEVHSNFTESVSSARLYCLRFTEPQGSTVPGAANAQTTGSDGC